MIWRRIKIGCGILLGLVLLVPSLIYVSEIDFSGTYTASVYALPIYDGTQKTGTYRLRANGLEFKTRMAGLSNSGDNVILLHGFPETSCIWEPLIDTASVHGYRILAFDQRGYSPGARPSGKDNYHIDSLVTDLLAVADRVGFDKFHLVGHDWGASVGWKAVMDRPDRIQTWTALSIPHMGIYLEAIQHDPEQQKRSSYVNLIRMPILPELLYVLNKNKSLESIKNIWSDKEIAEVQALFSEHGALTAGMNWYRAAENNEEYVQSFKKKITCPTLYIWGSQDHVVAPHIIPLQKALIEAPYQEVELDAGHSLVQEEKDTVIGLLLKHWGELKD